MQVDTDTNVDELPDDHPIANVLNAREKALYLSAVRNAEKVADRLKESYETNLEEFDPESSELVESTNQLRDALTLAELIEEVATRRKQEKKVRSTPTEEEFSENSHNIRTGER